MSTTSLPPQVRVSPDGQWLAWRSIVDIGDTWSVMRLVEARLGSMGVGQLTSRAVQDWRPLVAVEPLLTSWKAEVEHCVGDQPGQECAECAGLTLAINTVERAAQV